MPGRPGTAGPGRAHAAPPGRPRRPGAGPAHRQSPGRTPGRPARPGRRSGGRAAGTGQPPGRHARQRHSRAVWRGSAAAVPGPRARRQPAGPAAGRAHLGSRQRQRGRGRAHRQIVPRGRRQRGPGQPRPRPDQPDRQPGPGPARRASHQPQGAAMNPAVPTWAGVAASLALVAAAIIIAWRQRLHLAREITIAAARAGLQLTAVGAILLLVFQHAGPAGAAGWLTIMVTIAGQVAARRARGLPATDAFAPHLHAALRTALIPSIDSTKTVGLISLPGAMTGLILAGISPLTAIRVQIVVMYMLLAAAALAALTAARLAGHALFDDAHRLRPLPAPAGNDHR